MDRRPAFPSDEAPEPKRSKSDDSGGAPPRRVIAFIGSSDMGKTTIIRALLGCTCVLPIDCAQRVVCEASVVPGATAIRVRGVLISGFASSARSR